MIKKILLLLLVSANLSADLDSWRFRNDGIASMLFMTTLGGMVAIHDKRITELRATLKQNQIEGSSNVSDKEIEAEIVKLRYAIAAELVALAIVFLPPFMFDAYDIYQSWFPCDEYKARAIEAREKLGFLQARAKFRNCLFKSDVASARGIYNVPVHCQDVAQAFVQCGGKDEMIKMLATFDKYWK